MKILAIETSCDETAAAVVESESPTRPVKVLSNIVTSSEEMHKKTGGIVPEVASREQVKAIIPVIDMALAEARISKSEIRNEIDAIAVTVGPGLVGSLLVGVETARALAYAWEKPIIPVNHLIAHLYANFVGEIFNSQFSIFNEFSNSNFQIPKFPAVGLVVSGGHTDLVLIADKIQLLGTTRDDAAGECFDKGARILGLPYPGGPAVAAEATKFEIRNPKSEIKLPRPLMNEETYDFSFSGLKTAVGRLVREFRIEEKITEGTEDNRGHRELVSEIAYEIQEAIVDVLVSRVMRAVEEFRPKSVLLGGGVASNNRLRQLLKSEIRNSKHETKLFIPDPKLCTDNAVMIGAAALRLTSFAQGKLPTSWQEVKSNPGLEIV